MKYLIILGDGMADHPVAQLGNKTPLEVARKETIDQLTKEGCTGILETVPKGIQPGSEAANLSVLGYDPKKVLQGRGVLEAASMGIQLSDTQMAMRCNTLTIKEDGTILNHSAGHISTEEASIILNDFQKEFGNEKLAFYPGVSYRHVFIGDGMSSNLECYPPHDHIGESVSDLLVKPLSGDAKQTADQLNRLMSLSQKWLPNHPVNINRVKQGKAPANSLWFWSPGYRPKMWTYQEHFGLKGAVITAVDLIRGIAVYAGLDIIEVPGATGLFDTNYEGKAQAAIDALKRCDFVYVHVEAPDEAGHDGNLQLKIQTIEDLDHRLIRPLLQSIKQLGEPVRIGILPDHPTPVETRAHSREAIPFTIWGEGISADSVTTYNEESCKKGGYGFIKGDQFIRLVLGR